MATTDLLTTTTHALQNGLTSIPLSTAIENAGTWKQELLQSGEPALQDISRELGNLESLLSMGSAGMDARAIGASLSMLGSQTSQAAASAPSELRASLTALADSLLRAGGQLEEAQ
ncbi:MULTISPECIES: hypothetical protein [Hymenobacter]|uniref:Uncharacterized protein n=1 Tax=Hymenobacter mucosus TaxID=1411120 RepID=A0A238Y921_9BACT|nr:MULTISPECIES: hypothetical protein [Hymenobacter]SNR67452.1 hypothetical protein SAMN06269173_10540 [Hymenobacter mucosus]